MRATVLGSLAVLVVLYFGVFAGSANPGVFLNAHAIILVIGGTFAVMMMVYPFKKILDIVDFLTFGFFLHRKKSDTKVIEDLVIGLHLYLTNFETFRFHNVENAFTNEGFHLLRDSLLTDHQVEVILKSRKEAVKKKYQSEAKMLLNISKFPPALGLLGAATGMIEMMSMLGKEGVEVIGAAMSVALTATFWGIGIANFVFLPLADYASRLAQEDLYTREAIIEGILMAKRGYPERVIIEHLMGKLPISARFELKQKFMQSQEIAGVESHAA